MVLCGYRLADRLPGVAGWRFCVGFPASWLLHHQKPATPNNAARIAPNSAILITQRIASLAITKKMASRIIPAIMKMVVKDMGFESKQ